MRKISNPLSVILLAGALSACSIQIINEPTRCGDYAKELISRSKKGINSKISINIYGLSKSHVNSLKSKFYHCLTERIHELSNGRYLGITDKRGEFKIIDTSRYRNEEI